ncbi:histidine kinase CKI1 [Malania oleifera]|uniref:histidine kinase CKI1 n=1 Tax=Malania oleifera TaxID=397392 RepID=UPI0025AE5055|nr:histidine kinase CKI1 [Malania oleifera]
MIKRIERNVQLNSHATISGLQSEIEKNAKLLLPVNSLAKNLARDLNSSLGRTKVSTATINTAVAPVLFQALSVVPYLSQISYIGFDGLFFAYYTKGNQTLAAYSRSSSKYAWYTQPVDGDTGKLYGKAINFNPSTILNSRWFREPPNATNGHNASLEIGLNNAQGLLFLNTAGMARNGAISVGFPVKAFTDFLPSIDFYNGSLYLATKDGKVLKEGIPNTSIVPSGSLVSLQVTEPNGHQIDHVGNISCQLNHGELRPSFLKIQGTMYKFYCSPLEIAGIQSVYVLAFPCNGLMNLVQKDSKLSLILLMSMIATMVISIFAFVLLVVRAARREMFLCHALIKQMEATRQAETKSTNKSLAFASANHDVRASLAGITGLIDLCHDEVGPNTKIKTILVQMEACTKDLLGILNTILDTSKIEAGKMQLEEEEFNLAQLVEDVVDLYHPVGIKKGIDVVLDPYDGSINKFSCIKGDRGKLRQILCNLLSNAIKFTSEGHVTIRAWAKRPSTENSVLASKTNDSFNCFSYLFYKNSEQYSDLDSINAFPKTSHSMEFVFEVDDTGKGIPKEKQKSVFENFVQVKETALGQEGTGLGLGIVRSLVQLMGGEIGIVDKEVGKKGTCFRFNIFLTTCEAVSTDDVREDITELQGDCIVCDSDEQRGVILCTPSPKKEGSLVVLLIQSKERRRIAKKFMESLGIKALVVKQWENLACTLKKIENKMDILHYSSSGNSDSCSPRSISSNSTSKDVPMSSMHGADQILPVHRRNNPRGSNSVLLLIDANAGPFPELQRVVAEFRKDLCTSCCKVVWLDKQKTVNTSLKGLEKDKLALSDHIISKPFHGSRLYQAVKLLPEFERVQGGLAKPKSEDICLVGKVSAEPKSSANQMDASMSEPGNEPAVIKQLRLIENKPGSASNETPLIGKRILVVEDSPVFRRVVMVLLNRLGAHVELCENGEEAVELVCKGLSDLQKHAATNILPYDYILMDCEMPKMDGFEATRQIRKEEKYYGTHIPIIALSAHDTTGEEANKMIQAGMDVHLAKPLKREQILETIQRIHGK